MNNVKVDTSSCLKPCSGLIVTSFYKSEQKKNLETLFPIFGEYEIYKKVTTYPAASNGIDVKNINAREIYIFLFDIRL